MVSWSRLLDGSLKTWRMFFSVLNKFELSILLYNLPAYISVLFGAILNSRLSYRFVENWFLRLKNRV